MIEQLEHLIELVVEWPVFLPLLAILSTADALIPFIPSDPVIATAASWSGITGSPHLWQVFAVASAGAIVGNNLCYLAGRRLSHRIQLVAPRSRFGRALARIKTLMARYGGATIILARYLPYARWVLTLLLGSIGYRWVLFFLFDTIGVIVWAGSLSVVSYLGGLLFHNAPLIGVVVGIVAGTSVGIGIQKVQRHWLEWRSEKRATSRG